MQPTHSRVWDVDFSRADFAGVVDWCLSKHKVNRVLMVLRLERTPGGWVPLAGSAEECLRTVLGRRIISESVACRWPGTELVGHPARVVVARFSEELALALLRVEEDPRRWTHNNERPLPEDICLFRAGAAYPVFVSCSHESDFWLVSSEPPRLPGVGRSQLSLEDLLIPDGTTFYVPWADA